MFSGVPYAEPPVNFLRFSPPRSPEPWRGTRESQEFAPVCPQVVPKLQDEMKPVRYEYLERLLPYLKNQSEDCLYLNIYTPHQPEGKRTEINCFEDRRQFVIEFSPLDGWGESTIYSFYRSTLLMQFVTILSENTRERSSMLKINTDGICICSPTGGNRMHEEKLNRFLNSGSIKKLFYSDKKT